MSNQIHKALGLLDRRIDNHNWKIKEEIDKQFSQRILEQIYFGVSAKIWRSVVTEVRFPVRDYQKIFSEEASNV